MEIFIAYFSMVSVGGIALWVVAKIFSADPPNIYLCFGGAAIAEFISLFKIPFISLIALMIVLVKIGGFQVKPAIFATILYGLIKIAIFGLIIATLAKIFA